MSDELKAVLSAIEGLQAQIESVRGEIGRVRQSVEGIRKEAVDGRRDIHKKMDVLRESQTDQRITVERYTIKCAECQTEMDDIKKEQGALSDRQGTVEGDLGKTRTKAAIYSVSIASGVVGAGLAISKWSAIKKAFLSLVGG